MADVDLVEREQPLAVVNFGEHHAALFQELLDVPARRDFEQRLRRLRRVRHEHSGMMPMTGCPVRYFATFATSPSCPTTTMMSSGANRNRDRSPRSTIPRRQSTGITEDTVVSAV